MEHFLGKLDGPQSSRPLQNQHGQAIVEYLLMVSLALTMVGIMSRSFRGTVTALWTTFNKDIAAPCPGCSHPRLNPQ